jgi:NAD(P)-dependent dehydrogenase (short-subunit alcohol dehydrogenase family)
MNLVITGASRGIGRSICLYFAERGWNIAFCSREKYKVEKLLEELRLIHPDGIFLGLTCDVSDKAQLLAYCDNVCAKFDTIHCLVNNAGTFTPGETISEREGNLEHLMATNLYSAYYTTRYLLEAIPGGEGHIFNMSSVAGIRAYPNGGSYAITKHAMLGYSRTLREELKSKRIKVTALLPGATLTDSWAGASLPEDRFMSPEDIAKCVWDIYQLGPNTVVEEIILRPLPGDI